jgi:fimbrial chaperone protein
MTPRVHGFVLATATALAGCLPCAPALGGEFVVTPVGLDLGGAARSGAITIRNDGKDKLGFELEAMEWRQDAEGKDQYVATNELVFYPKIMTVEPGQEGLVRVGIRTPLVQTEKTYRLFIQELPGTASAPASSTAQVNFLIRFGAPIFVGPVKPQDSLTVDSLAIVKGGATFSAHNTGNRHQVVQGVSLKGVDRSGREVYSLTLADRYLLAGTAKTFSATIPPADCARISSLSVEVRTDKLSTVRKLDVDPTMCP